MSKFFIFNGSGDFGLLFKRTQMLYSFPLGTVGYRVYSGVPMGTAAGFLFVPLVEIPTVGYPFRVADAR